MSKINWHTFENSSFMHSCHYDDKNKILFIQFNNGTVTPHYDCPQTVFDGLCKAESAGKHYHTHVRGKYRTE
jgi:KTSC domain